MQPETEKPPGGGFGCVSASRPGTFFALHCNPARVAALHGLGCCLWGWLEPQA